MPKQVWKIDKFEGGINDKADPRDILDSQFVQADGIEVNNVGKIVIGGGKTIVFETGDTEPESLADSETTTHGYGLVKFGTDYDKDAAVAETKYLGFHTTNGDALKILTTTSQTLHGSSSDWSSLATGLLSSGTNQKAVFYYADGALRVCDANFDNANDDNKWIGVVKRTLFGGLGITDEHGGNTAAVAISEWVTTGSTPTTPSSTQLTWNPYYNGSNAARREKGTWHIVEPLMFFKFDGQNPGWQNSTGIDMTGTMQPQNAYITGFDFFPTDIDQGSNLTQGARFYINGAVEVGTTEQNTWHDIYSVNTGLNINDGHGIPHDTTKLPYSLNFESTTGVEMRVHYASGHASPIQSWHYYEGAGATWQTGDNKHLPFSSGYGCAHIGAWFYEHPIGSTSLRAKVFLGGGSNPDLVTVRTNKYNANEGTAEYFWFNMTKSAYVAVRSLHSHESGTFSPSMWEGTSERRTFDSIGVEFLNGTTVKWKWLFNPADFSEAVRANKHFLLELDPMSAILRTLPEDDTDRITAVAFTMEFTSLVTHEHNEPVYAILQVSDLHIGDSGCAMNPAGFSAASVDYGVTNVIDGDSESAIAPFTSTAIMSASRYFGNLQNTAIIVSWSMREAANVDSGSYHSWWTNLSKWGAGKRTKGQNLYIKKTDSDNWYRVAEVDFGSSTLQTEKGGIDKAFGKFDLDTPWYNGNFIIGSNTYQYPTWWVTGTSAGVYSSYLVIKEPSLIWEYSVLNAFSSTSYSLKARFKTSTQMNRQIYIGNVHQQSISYSDRLIKSPVNKFDIFPSQGREIDVIVKDGDHITAVEGFADRILQFKKNSTNVINCTKDSEFLETTLNNVGVEGPWAVIKTDIGIAFINDRGCFLYDGEKFVNLIENKIDDCISGTWDTHVTSSSLIGYQQKGRKILVTGGTDNADVYMFSLQTGGWTKLPGVFGASSHTQTNLVTFFDGMVYWVDCHSGNPNYAYVWQDKVAQDITIVTKDIDFGHPGVKKKVSKIYVTYTTGGASADSNVEIFYYTNGGVTRYDFTGISNYSTDGTAGAGSAFNDSAGMSIAELKPDDTTEANNIYSIQLKFATISGQTPPAGFEINDISIVYRMKNVK